MPLGESRGKGAKSHEKARPHDTSRIAWAKLIAHIAEDFPLACPACGGDIRLIAFIVDPAPIRKILTHLGGAGGGFLPTPNQPSDTVQLGVGAIGGPWAY